MDDAEVTAVAQRLADMLGPGDLDETLRGITRAAVEVLPDVDYASITVRHADGRLQTSAPTDNLLRGLDASQYELQEGPCYASATDEVHLTSPRLAEDDRFPRYREVAVRAGVQAQAGIRLFDTDRSAGALNLYSRRAGAFEDLGFLGALFTHHSALALRYAQEVESLRDAIVTRELIGQAVGISMERYEFTDEQAFAFLTRLAGYTDTPLSDVARAVVDAGRSRAQPT